MQQGNAKYEVGVYYFPNYHVDPRNEAIHGPGWMEWELVKRGAPRFPGQQQPKVPLWGYEDESDPRVFGKKIDAAADHGINHFIFDWYWYNDGPFLNRGLDNGYMGAANNHRLKFALMWANHNWADIHPAKSFHEPNLLYPGEVTRETFDRMTDHIIKNYFCHHSYWTIDGCPYFSVYELNTLLHGLGGPEATAEALQDFRKRTKAAGFPDLHLNTIIYITGILPGETILQDPAEIVAALGLDSVTTYVWIHHVAMANFPTSTYDSVAKQAQEYWRTVRDTLPVPYYPNVTMGWDSTPRLCQSDVYTAGVYPSCPTLVGNTPEAFKRSLENVKAFLDEKPDKHCIMSINAWNEWTEGSYLEPDIINGMGYLEAIKQVFR